MSTSTLPGARSLGVPALLLALSLTACGSGEESPDSSAPAPSTSSAAPAEQTDPTGTTSGEAEQRFGLDLETTGDTIVETLENATDYSVDGSTLTVTFSEGEAEGMDGTMDCMSVSGLMSADETLVLSYPDGDVTC